MSRLRTRYQRGQALILMLIVIVMGSAWYLVSRLHAESAAAVASRKVRNADVLNRAKQALIGYVAAQTAEVGERNPGRLPCPEGASYVGDANSEGIAWSGFGTPCTSIGRLPWRTLGLEKLLDSAGEPLWYVVGQTWRLTSSTDNLTINSNTAGDITVDGQSTVALIIAPGQAMNAAAATGCTAKIQTRSTPSPSIDAANYLECFNSATLAFTTTASSSAYNDQAIRITTADLMPVIEAVIAKRIENEVVPVLKTVYADPTWGTSTTNPAFAFPAAFSDPTASSYLGDTSTTQGLLPFNYHSSSCGGDARCSTSAITWGTPTATGTAGTGVLWGTPSCTLSGTTVYCEGYYRFGTVNVSMTDPAMNITKGLRTLVASSHTGTYYAYDYNSGTWIVNGQPATTNRSLASNASVNFTTSATLPSVADWGYWYLFQTRPADSNFGDHAILSSTDAATGWFVRNEWYRLMYYAIAANHRPGQSYSCSDTGVVTCLTVTNMTDSTKQRAILILANRSLSTLSQTRPSSSLQNYLDANVDTVTNSLSSYMQSTPSKSYNDRFISLSKNP